MGAASLIRTMTMDDYEEVLLLWKGAQGIGLSAADSPENIAVYLKRNLGLSFVATADGGIIGAVLCGHDGRRGYIHHLAVSEPYRGQGIGRGLVERCLTGLQTEGIDKCHLFVFTDNELGQGFWRRLGFQPRTGLTICSKDI